MAVPASKFIADLGGKKSATAPAASRDTPAGPEALRLFAVHKQVDPQQRLVAAHAQGVEEGKAAAQAEWQAKLEEQRAYYEKQLAVERLTWAGREADRLAEQLDRGLEEMKARIADAAAVLLKPFLIAAVHQRAIADLVQAIETVLVKDEGVTLEIAGPDDLLQLLRERLSGRNMALLYTASEGLEVRVIAGQTILETQLVAWLAKVEEALR